MPGISRLFFATAPLALLCAPVPAAAQSATDSVLAVSQGGRSLLRVDLSGNVGVATSAPDRRLVVDSGGVAFNGEDGFVAGGAFGAGAIPATGAGARLMWYPRKAAFRAGAAAGPEWDDASVGGYSAAFGHATTASGTYATALGTGTSATGSGSVAMGSNTTATGSYSLAMGFNTTASGSVSTALGYYATAGRSGSFVYADAATSTVFNASANHEFSVRASGGVRFFTSSNLASGVTLSAGGGSWNTVSDRGRKEHFLSVDGEVILSRIRELPVSTWRYLAEKDRSVRHIGPMAQDWSRAFGFSSDSLTINSGDIDGVNLAAAQALTHRTDDLRDADADHLERIRALEEENAALHARLDRIEEMLAESPEP